MMMRFVYNGVRAGVDFYPPEKNTVDDDVAKVSARLTLHRMRRGPPNNRATFLPQRRAHKAK